VPLDVSVSVPAAGPLAAASASERVTGSPLPGSTNWTVRGLPGYRAVLFKRAACHPPRRSPLARPIASGSAAFWAENPFSTGICFFSRLTHAAHSFACLRFNRPLTAHGCKAGYQPAGYALAGVG